MKSLAISCRWQNATPKRCRRTGVLRYHRFQRWPCGSKSWVSRVAEVIDIPFCVAGGLSLWKMPRKFFPLARIKFPQLPCAGGPDVNYSPGGSIWRQCIVVGIDTWYDAETGKYHGINIPAMKAAPASLSGKRSTGTGSAKTRCRRNRPQHDESGGVRNGYDLEQLKKVREVCHAR